MVLRSNFSPFPQYFQHIFLIKGVRLHLYMFICEIRLFDWYFPQFFKSDMSKYGYLEVLQGVPSTSRKRESNVYLELME